MILYAPLALIGLLLLPLLVVLHLRRQHYRPVDVSSTLVWRELLGESPARQSWTRLYTLLPLLLQLLAVALLVLALARPEFPAAAQRAGAAHVYVVDDSLRMAAADVRPNRLSVAAGIVAQSVQAEPAGTNMTVIAAAARPYVLVSSTNATTVRQALAALQPSVAPADLSGALRLAAGVLALHGQQQGSKITLLHAPEDAVPAVQGARSMLTATTVGQSGANQTILSFSARCTALPDHACTAFALVRNEDDRPVNDPLEILGGGDVLVTQSLALPAHADSGVSFPVPRGQRVLELRLLRPDILPLDNTAWCIVPAAAPALVTVVGEATGTARLAQALAGLPGVTVRTRTPASYRAADGAQSDLLILARWRPAGTLPAAPAVLLVDPPSLPGGRVGDALADSTVSGLDGSSPLLADIDLTSLDVSPGAAETLATPSLTPVVWAAGGPLLAASQTGGQRLAVLAFDPLVSNLPQLSAYPELLWNLVRWSTDWAPASAVAGEAVLIPRLPGTTQLDIARTDGAGGADATMLQGRGSDSETRPFVAAEPGVYTVVERGPQGRHSARIAVNVDEEAPLAAAPVVLASSGGNATASGAAGPGMPWWPWIGLAALLAIVAEWLYAPRSMDGPGTERTA